MKQFPEERKKSAETLATNKISAEHWRCRKIKLFQIVQEFVLFWIVQEKYRLFATIHYL